MQRTTKSPVSTSLRPPSFGRQWGVEVERAQAREDQQTHARVPAVPLRGVITSEKYLSTTNNHTKAKDSLKREGLLSPNDKRSERYVIWGWCNGLSGTHPLSSVCPTTLSSISSWSQSWLGPDSEAQAGRRSKEQRWHQPTSANISLARTVSHGWLYLQRMPGILSFIFFPSLF